ncbi:hypothetical protein Tco_0981800 [Tanacetum coccineum]
MVSNGESWYAHDKVIDKSSVSNVEKASCGKRILDVECKNGFRFGFKEDKVIHANDFASTSTASLVKPESAQVYKKTKKQTDIWNRVIPTATRFNEVQRTVGMIKLGQQGLVMSLVDSEASDARLYSEMCRMHRNMGQSACALPESIAPHLTQTKIITALRLCSSCIACQGRIQEPVTSIVLQPVELHRISVDTNDQVLSISNWPCCAPYSIHDRYTAEQ